MLQTMFRRRAAYLRDSIVLVMNIISYCRIAHADGHDPVIVIS